MDLFNKTNTRKYASIVLFVRPSLFNNTYHRQSIYPQGALSMYMLIRTIPGRKGRV